jgi:hypothetical protein
MALENSLLDLDRSFPPLATLEAIELPDYPETHLQPFQPERHKEALRKVARRVLDTTAMDLSRLTDSVFPTDTSDEQVIEQLVAELESIDALTLLLFEDRWKRQGSLLGYVSLRQTEEDRSMSRATFTAFTSQDIWGKYSAPVAESLFAAGIEHWGIESIKQPHSTSNDDILHLQDILSFQRRVSDLYSYDGLYPHFSPPTRLVVSNEYDLKYTHETRLHFLVRERRFYSSRFGEIMSRFHWMDAYCELLADDIRLSEKQVAINGLHMTAQTRRDLLSSCQDAVEKGVSVEVNLNFPPSSEEARRVVEAFKDVGVKLQVRPHLPKAAIIDGRVWWESNDSALELRRLGVMRRVEAEREIPVPVIQLGRLIWGRKHDRAS